MECYAEVLVALFKDSEVKKLQKMDLSVYAETFTSKLAILVQDYQLHTKSLACNLKVIIRVQIVKIKNQLTYVFCQSECYAKCWACFPKFPCCREGLYPDIMFVGVTVWHLMNLLSLLPSTEFCILVHFFPDRVQRNWVFTDNVTSYWVYYWGYLITEGYIQTWLDRLVCITVAKWQWAA